MVSWVAILKHIFASNQSYEELKKIPFTMDLDSDIHVF